MDLKITSKEIIKPCSPTPHQQRTYKLSLLDQLNPGAYFSVILFYYSAGPSQEDTIIKTSDHLKKSLSETLTHFYPFAGQFKDNDIFVDCNDDGVPFIEAHLTGDMSEVIKQAETTDIREQLIPCKPHETARADRNLLLVQVNYFGCGGMAIGFCFHHRIADGATAANFIKSWGAIARGAHHHHNDDFSFRDVVVYDSFAIFPARVDLPDMSFVNPDLRLGMLSLNSVVKRFTFDGNKIASLREKIAEEEESCCLDYRPTRVEVVSSVILSAVLAAYKGSVTAIIIAVNLRKRMNPPLPEQSFGNITSSAFLNLPIDDDDDDDDDDDEKKVNYSRLAGEVHKSIKMVDDQFVRKLYGEGEVLNMLRGGGAAPGLSKKRKVFVISSWCKLPFYEADFGLGKPISIGLGTRFTEAAVLVDSCTTTDDDDDCQGVEAWVGLSEQDMTRFQQHPAILAYTSS